MMNQDFRHELMVLAKNLEESNEQLKVDYSRILLGQGISGEYKGSRFHITYLPDIYCLISMEDHKEHLLMELVESLDEALDYKSFVKYHEVGDTLLTIEWDKKDPVGRLAELRDKLDKSELYDLKSI